MASKPKSGPTTLPGTISGATAEDAGKVLDRIYAGRKRPTKLSEEEKADRARQRMLEQARQYQTSTYMRKFVAPLFQQMIRAEFGAEPLGVAPAMMPPIDAISWVPREVGQCVCVTCGTVKAWDSGIKGIHCGHFLASRRNSILLEEDNCAPQCSHCNYYRSGEQQLFRRWMLAVRGLEVVERLERLKNEVRSFGREELVDLRIGYAARLKAAEERMKGL